MNWQQVVMNQHQMQEHFLYFAIGFCASTILWTTLVIGIFLGAYRRRLKDQKP
jgi:hypothetical protein